MFLKYLLLSVLLLPSVYAVEGGYSNYTPGLYNDFEVALPPKQGFSLRHDIYFYQAQGSRSQVKLVDGVWVNTYLDEFTKMTQNLTALYYTFEEIDNWLILSTGFQNTHADIYNRSSSSNTIENIRQSDSAMGIADITTIPITAFWKNQNIFYSSSLTIVIPTSSFDKNKISNLSANYWTVDLALAATYLNREYGIEASLVPGLIYNTKNKTTSYHSGTEIHLEYMFNKEIIKNFNIGLQGYIQDQVTNDNAKDINFDGIKTRAHGLGPAVRISNIWGSHVSIVSKWLHEYYARNRIDNGDNLFVSLIYDG